MRKKILIILLAVFVLLILFKDVVIKNIITTVGTKVVGTKLEIDKFSFKVFSQKIRIQGVKLYNPKGFPDEPLIFIDEVAVNYNLGQMLSGKIYSSLVVLDVRELVVIKNKEGLMNVDEIPILKAQQDVPPDDTKAPPAKESPEINMQIDLLRLNVGKVVFKDYSGEGEPKIEAYSVGLSNKEYKNIQSPEQLVGLIMVEAMKGTAIKGAKIYGMASIASIVGIGFLPAGVATVLISKDHAMDEYPFGLDDVFNASLALFNEKGTLGKEDKAEGFLKGNLEDCDVAIKLEEISDKKTKITVSARKWMLPKPKIAGGIIHQISLKLESQ